MPIYEFICSKCDNKFDAIVKMDARVTSCPDCNGKSKRDGDIELSSFMLGTDGKTAGFDRPCFGERKYE